jgi:hypothetical protein
MSTRSLTYVYDEEGKPLVCIYKQSDGYVKGGLGELLQRFLRGRKVCNGYGSDNVRNGDFNGMGNVAMQVLWMLGTIQTAYTSAYMRSDNKEVPSVYPCGGVYLYPTDTKPGECGDEFVYRIRPTEDGGGITLTVQSSYRGQEHKLPLSGEALSPDMFFAMETCRA